MLTETMSNDQHVSCDRATAFLIDGAELEPLEEEHLFSCDVCREVIVQSTVDSLKKDPTK
jgi:hypothetical protein